MIVRKDVLLLALKEEHVQHALLVGCSKILQLFHAPSAPQASSKGYVGSGTAHVVRGDSMLLTLGHIHAWCAQMGRCRAILPLLHALHVLQANPKRIAENAVFDFELSDEQMARMDALDQGFYASNAAKAMLLPWEEVR